MPTTIRPHRDFSRFVELCQTVETHPSVQRWEGQERFTDDRQYVTYTAVRSAGKPALTLHYDLLTDTCTVTTSSGVRVEGSAGVDMDDVEAEVHRVLGPRVQVTA